MASNIEEHLKNKKIGFKCLHYSVSEALGFIAIPVLNKTGEECKIGVRTLDGDAKAGDDYVHIDTTLEFKKN